MFAAGWTDPHEENAEQAFFVGLLLCLNTAKRQRASDRQASLQAFDDTPRPSPAQVRPLILTGLPLHRMPSGTWAAITILSLGVGLGAAVGAGVGSAGTGLGVGALVVGAGVGSRVGSGVESGVGTGVGLGIGVGAAVGGTVGSGVGSGVEVAVGGTAGAVVGAAVGAASAAANRSPQLGFFEVNSSHISVLRYFVLNW